MHVYKLVWMGMYDAILVGSVVDNTRSTKWLQDKASPKLHNAQSLHSKATNRTCDRSSFLHNVQLANEKLYPPLKSYHCPHAVMPADVED